VVVIEEFEQAPCIGRPWVARERRAEGDHATHVGGDLLCEFARVHATEAPSHQADARAVFLRRLLHQRAQGIDYAVAWTEVEALVPRVRDVTTIA